MLNLFTGLRCLITMTCKYFAYLILMSFTFTYLLALNSSNPLSWGSVHDAGFVFVAGYLWRQQGCQCLGTTI